MVRNFFKGTPILASCLVLSDSLRWHQDVKPDNILVLSNGSRLPFEWKFKLADLGISHFKSDSSSRDSMASDTWGTITYGRYKPKIASSSLIRPSGAPECYRQDLASKQIKLRVKQNVDIWSLGCIYSEAARWIVDGTEGIKQYREERKAETRQISAFGSRSDCFHSKDSVLNAVRSSHERCVGRSRDDDFATKVVVEMVSELMLVSADRRSTAGKLWRTQGEILETAKSKLAVLDGVAATPPLVQYGIPGAPDSPPATPRKCIPKSSATYPPVTMKRSGTPESHEHTLPILLGEGHRRPMHSPELIMDSPSTTKSLAVAPPRWTTLGSSSWEKQGYQIRPPSPIESPLEQKGVLIPLKPRPKLRQSGASDYMALQEALNWKQSCKANKSTTVGLNKDLQRRLKDRDHVRTRFWVLIVFD